MHTTVLHQVTDFGGCWSTRRKQPSVVASEGKIAYTVGRGIFEYREVIFN